MNVASTPAMAKTPEICNLLKGRKRSFDEIDRVVFSKSMNRAKYPFLKAPLRAPFMAGNIDNPYVESIPEPCVSLLVNS